MTHDEFTKLFKYIERRFDDVDARFDAVDQRLNSVDARFDSIVKIIETFRMEIAALIHKVNRLEMGR